MCGSRWGMCCISALLDISELILAIHVVQLDHTGLQVCAELLYRSHFYLSALSVNPVNLLTKHTLTCTPWSFVTSCAFFFMWIFKLSEICHLPAKLHHLIALSRDQPCTELSCQRTHVEFEMGRAHTAWVALERINSLLGVTATILQSAQSVCLTQIRLSGEPRLPTVRTPGFHSL